MALNARITRIICSPSSCWNSGARLFWMAMNGPPFALPSLPMPAIRSASLTGSPSVLLNVLKRFLGHNCGGRRRDRLGGNDQVVVPGISGWQIPARILIGHIREECQAVVIVCGGIVFQHEILHFDPLS